MFDSSCQADATTSSSIVAGLVYLCGMEGLVYLCGMEAGRQSCLSLSLYIYIYIHIHIYIYIYICVSRGVNSINPIFVLYRIPGRDM